MSEIVVTVKLPEGVDAEGVEVTVDPMPAQTEESSEQVIAQPIETAPKDDDGDAWILASTSGKVWFQACWDPEDECWVTFNRYAEVGYGRRQPGWKFEPKFWLPIPAPAEARSVEAFSSGPDRVAMALYDGFTVGISRLPWGDCYDWAALVARDYSAGKPLPAPPKATPAEMIEACITDIKAGLCCPRVHGCEQNDGEFCLVRQAFARAGLIADPYAAQAEGEA